MNQNRVAQPPPAVLLRLSLPAAHTFRPFLKRSGKRANTCSKQQAATLRSSGIDKLDRPDQTPPAARKKFGKLFILRKYLRNSEIVFMKDPPKRLPRKQITRVINRQQYLLQGAQKDSFILSCAASNPAEHLAVFAPVRVHMEPACFRKMLADGPCMFERIDNHIADLAAPPPCSTAPSHSPHA